MQKNFEIYGASARRRRGGESARTGVNFSRFCADLGKFCNCNPKEDKFLLKLLMFLYCFLLREIYKLARPSLVQKGAHEAYDITKGQIAAHPKDNR